MSWAELPKRLEYALQSLCCLVWAEGPTHANEVARRAGIPRAEAAKILHQLTWGGFVFSRRGSKGGFWLRMPPDRVHVGDIIKFLYPLVPEGGSPDGCIGHLWKQTAASGYETFEHYTLQDLSRESHEWLGGVQPAARHEG